jgi:DNA-binding GntR family transcriptional regulator
MGAVMERKGRGTKGMSAADVVQELRVRIATHRLAPGAKLQEQTLAAEFNVSRARVREAVGLLAQRGLVRRIPNRGAVVERLDLTQVFEIYDVREMLEALCARLATQNRPPEHWQDLVDLFADPVGGYVERRDLEAYIVALEQFRRRTLEAAANPILRDMLDSIHDKTRAIIRRIIILPGRAEQGLAEHRAVLGAMRQGDAEAAERLKRDNIRSAREYLRRYQTFVL